MFQLGILATKKRKRKNSCPPTSSGTDSESQVRQEKTFVCPEDSCDCSYYNKRNLQAHQRTVHEGIKYTCDQCEKHFCHKVYTHAVQDVLCLICNVYLKSKSMVLLWSV